MKLIQLFTYPISKGTMVSRNVKINILDKIRELVVDDYKYNDYIQILNKLFISGIGYHAYDSKLRNIIHNEITYYGIQYLYFKHINRFPNNLKSSDQFEICMYLFTGSGYTFHDLIKSELSRNI